MPDSLNPTNMHTAETGMDNHHEHRHAYEMSDVEKAGHREEVLATESHHHQHALWKCITAALMYGVVSSLMTFCNKALSSSYNFSFPLFLLVVQMATTQAGLCLLHICRVQTSLFFGFGFEYPTITFKGLLVHLPVASLYVLNAALAISSLQGMSIPT
jgi:K+-sensing histidine kinase KdpD